MGLGIVTDEDFAIEMENSSVPDSLIPSTESGRVIDVGRGRPIGGLGVPDSLRKIIGETSEIEGPQSAVELANQFGISRSSVSAYANGSTSTTSYDKQPNLNHINLAKEKISLKARNRLFKALNHLTDEKFADSKAIELASIAKSMSGIVKEMEPTTSRVEDKNGPTFIFYSPQVHDEKYYDIVFTKE